MAAGIIILFLLAAVFWTVQLVSLMRMPDDAFAGKYDKPLWVAVLLVTFLLGAFAFWIWKWYRQAEIEEERTANTIGQMVERTANAIGHMTQPPHKPNSPP